jgi:hypothetical protein
VGEGQGGRIAQAVTAEAWARGRRRVEISKAAAGLA